MIYLTTYLLDAYTEKSYGIKMYYEFTTATMDI